MSWRYQIILHLAVLAGVFALLECTNIDLWVQDRMYDSPKGQWILDKDEPVAKAVFYTGAKGLVIAVGVLCGVVTVLSLRRKELLKYQKLCFLMALSIVIVPSVTATYKHFSSIYIPRQIDRYGGDRPYRKVLDSFPPGYKPEKPGRGFPAGHASGGFALMMLYFAFRKRAWKILGLAVGIVMGWAMAIYQMLRGYHYLGDGLVATSMAWIMILLIHRGVEAIGRRRAARGA